MKCNMRCRQWSAKPAHPAQHRQLRAQAGDGGALLPGRVPSARQDRSHRDGRKTNDRKFCLDAKPSAEAEWCIVDWIHKEHAAAQELTERTMQEDKLRPDCFKAP